MKIVQLHDKPPITDIPKRLRLLADEIEARENPPSFVMVLIMPEHETDWPAVIGLGIDPGDLPRCGLVAQAQAWLTINKVARET